MVHIPTPFPLLSSEHVDDFELFADVSHHGSTLLESLLALEPGFPTSNVPSNSLHPESSLPAISDTTATPSEYPRSASTSHTAVPHHGPNNLTYQTVESFSSIGPTEQSSKPFTFASHTSPTSAQQLASSQSTPPPPLIDSLTAQKAANPIHPNSSKRRPSTAGRKPSVPPGKAIAKSRAPSTPSTGRALTRRKRIADRSANCTDANSRSADGLGNTDGSEQSEDAPKTVSKQQSSHSGAATGDASSVVDEAQGKDTHNSHTRRCRAKVNSKFQELLSILPTPPPKTGIKHKAQILDYTIRVFREIHARKMLLEAELALSSRTQLNAWIENVVSRSVTLQDAMAPYLSLICTKGGWKYSEAWVPTQDVPGDVARMGGVSGESRLLTPATLTIAPLSRLRLGLAVIPSLGNTDDPELQSKLEKFRDRSRSYGCKARVDLPGRVMCTMRPEWLPSLEDQEAFQRAQLARAATLVVCFGVPIFVRGHIAAVAVFFDTEQRPYDARCVDLADNLSAMLGNAYGASTLRKKAM